MRTALVAVLAVLLGAAPIAGRMGLALIAGEIGASVIAVGVYSSFVAGIFSDIQEVSAAVQRVPLAEVSLPRTTLLIAGGTALAAAPFVAGAVVNAVGGRLGMAAGGPAYALSVASAYVAAALVFDYEWKRPPSTERRLLLPWLPEWVVRLTVTTSLAATVGFNVGIAIG